MENGRTYHRFKEGKYYLPNDDAELERLDLQHHLYKLTFHGKLSLAPLEQLKNGLHNVMDIATGTGIWAIEFANEHPSTSVLGTDLSPVQPEFVPPNCRFEIDDAEDEWLYKHKFDYIHGRTLVTCFQDHRNVIKSAFENLNPGGYLEFQDLNLPITSIDNSMDGTALQHWILLCVEAARKLGSDWTRVPKYKDYFAEAGFVDVVEHRYSWPTNSWARGQHNKQLSVWYNQDCIDGIQAFSLAVLTRGLGMSSQEVEMMLVDVRKDIMNRNIHAYLPVYVVIGRKPE